MDAQHAKPSIMTPNKARDRRSDPNQIISLTTSDTDPDHSKREFLPNQSAKKPKSECPDGDTDSSSMDGSTGGFKLDTNLTKTYHTHGRHTAKLHQQRTNNKLHMHGRCRFPIDHGGGTQHGSCSLCAI